MVLADTNKRLSNALVDDVNNPSSLPSGTGKSECHYLDRGLHPDRQSFPEQSKKMKLTEQSIDGRLNEMLSLVQDLRDKLEKASDKLEKESDKLEKEKQERERDVKLLSTQLEKERADRKEDVEALRRVRLHVHVCLLSS